MMRVIGLDASTSTIGICILDYDEDGYQPSLVHYEYYKPQKQDSNKEKRPIADWVLEAREHIFNLIDCYDVTELVIEDYIRFMQGQSSAQTIIPLAILNMTLRIGVKDRYGWDATALTVGKVRHAIKRDHVLPKKEDIPALVSIYLFGIKEFPWFREFKPRKKVWAIMEESYDVADAMAVALAYVKLRSRPEKKKPSNKRKKTKRKKA